MKIGDVVKVYEDPLTEQVLECEARLIRCTCRDAGMWKGRHVQRWDVNFLDDLEVGEKVDCNRSILVS